MTPIFVREGFVLSQSEFSASTEVSKRKRTPFFNAEPKRIFSFFVNTQELKHALSLFIDEIVELRISSFQLLLATEDSEVQFVSWIPAGPMECNAVLAYINPNSLNLEEIHLDYLRVDCANYNGPDNWTIYIISIMAGSAWQNVTKADVLRAQ